MIKRDLCDALTERIFQLEAQLKVKDSLLEAKDSLLEAKDSQIEAKDSQIKAQGTLLQRKEERIVYLERLLWGGKKDKLIKQSEEGPTLFDDLFKKAYLEKQQEIQTTIDEVEQEATKRKQRRKSAPNRPSKYSYIGLEEEHRTVYPEGINLEEYDKIGSDVTRILHYTDPRIWVECIHRPILRAKAEKQSITPSILQHPAPSPIIGGNHVGADFLSKLIIDKYAYHIPEYRQVSMLAELGAKLPTSTINNWVHAVANKLYPLYETLIEHILNSSTYLQIDEVPWRIADRKESSCRKGYAWQFRDASPQSVGTYFYYHKGSRRGEIVRSQLKDYNGAAQTDGYAVYDYFEQSSNVIHLGCMAHVRRKFIEAQRSHPQEAAQAIKLISYLYIIEENLKERNATEQEIAQERKEKAIPIMNQMEKWMEYVSLRCTSDDLLGKALDYAYKLWPRLKHYCDDGRYQIDNNAVERGQRPSVMGRKNYLFSKNDRGAEDNAIIYSLLGSCDIAGINKRQWLTHVLNALSKEDPESDLLHLLPCNFKSSK